MKVVHFSCTRLSSMSFEATIALCDEQAIIFTTQASFSVKEWQVYTQILIFLCYSEGMT